MTRASPSPSARPERPSPARAIGAASGGAAAGAGDSGRTSRRHADGSTPSVSAFRLTLRYWIARTIVWILVRGIVRIRVEGRERLPPGPAIYCFNHLGWVDPFMLMATLPFRPRLMFFGPREEDMGVGARNRVMRWTGTAIPYKPGKNNLLEVTRRVGSTVEGGRVVAIAGEGRIHVGERYLLPLSEGAAYFALRCHVPLVPIAINGTSWVRFGARVRIRIGEPIPATGRPTHEALAGLTERAWADLHDLLADAPEVPEPGRFGRWLTERFNEWPEGSRAAAAAAQRAAGLVAADWAVAATGTAPAE